MDLDSSFEQKKEIARADEEELERVINFLCVNVSNSLASQLVNSSSSEFTFPHKLTPTR